MEIKQTKSQKELSWLVMLGKYEHEPTTKASYIKNDMDDPRICSRTNYKRTKSAEEVKHQKERGEEIARLLLSGMNMKSAYKQMYRAGQLLFKGRSISYGRFKVLCSVERQKNQDIPKLEYKTDNIVRLISEGFNREQICELLSVNKKDISQAINRKKKGI